MRLCQFYTSEAERDGDLARRMPVASRLGLLVGGRVVDITAEVARHIDLADPQYAGVLAAWVAGWDRGAALSEKLRAVVQAGEADQGGLDPEQIHFAPCVPRPSQYLDFYAFEEHVRTARRIRGLKGVPPEWYEIPAYYNSNPTSLIGHRMTAWFPPEEEQMDYECELACVIGRAIRNPTPAQARDAIAGYTLLNDFSCRQRQARAMPINMGPAPGKDFCSALGPFLVTPDEVADLAAVRMRAFVNEEQWTDGCYGSVRYRFEEMIVYAAHCRTLWPGDILGSGTVGGGCGLELGRYLQPGDCVRLEADGLGVLENRVMRAEAAPAGP